MHSFQLDTVAIAISALLLGYYAFLFARLRGTSDFTIHAIN